MSSDSLNHTETLFEHENAVLREKLVAVTKLLNHALRSAQGMQVKCITDELISVVSSLTEIGLKYKSAQSSLKQKSDTLQTLTSKQDQFITQLQNDLKQTKEMHQSQLFMLSKQSSENIEALQQDNAKYQTELATSRDQNKKLVQLIKKMEEKLKESEAHAETLDTQNLSLKQVCYNLKKQIDRLESQFEQKL